MWKFILISLRDILKSSIFFYSKQKLRWSKDSDLLLNLSLKFWKYPRSLYRQFGKSSSESFVSSVKLFNWLIRLTKDGDGLLILFEMLLFFFSMFNVTKRKNLVSTLPCLIVWGSRMKRTRGKVVKIS